MNCSMQPPSPDRIMQSSLAAHAVAATMAAACQHRLFTHIEAGAATLDQIATRAGISRRGAQALLDALVALGFVRVRDGRYTNAEFYLVEGQPAYLGAHAQLTHSPFGDAFRDLADVARTGVPRFQYTADTADNEFWEDLVLAIVPLAIPVVEVLLKSDLAQKDGLSLLDIGGGSGVYSAFVLQKNATARATQIDWPNVNRIGRAFVDRFGVGTRFTTIDGDFHTTDFGESAYDLVVLSNICHQESPQDNVALFSRVRRALKPGGALVLSEFLLEDDRTAAFPWCGIFHVFMLIQTKEGAAWRKTDFRSWLKEAGFTSIELEGTPTPSTLVWARE
ncbi:MAG TPA: methyltransferase [Gemmatimonadota bacterium]|nr:methyltransferase [Gemmatimonadota bacterium]